MSSSWGRNIKISIFGESHGPAVGIVLEGIRPGLKLDMEEIRVQMKRRAPGRDELSTSRHELDEVEFFSGVLDGYTTGTPITCIIKNRDAKSEDYVKQKTVFRPSHADHTGWVRYKGFNDYRGGGHFSGRLTAGLVCAGAIAMQILEEHGIIIASHIIGVGNASKEGFLDRELKESDLRKLKLMDFPVLDKELSDRMQGEILHAKADKDSLGGIVETVALGIQAGLGDPFFDSVESIVSSLIFSIPAVKGIEFGRGFSIAGMKGSKANDVLILGDKGVSYSSNNNGGVLGGITNGMPIVFRTAIKPTPSIGQPQKSIDMDSESEIELTLKGRHDPCIVRRIVPVIDAAAAIAVLDILMEGRKNI